MKWRQAEKRKGAVAARPRALDLHPNRSLLECVTAVNRVRGSFAAFDGPVTATYPFIAAYRSDLALPTGRCFGMVSPQHRDGQASPGTQCPQR